MQIPSGRAPVVVVAPDSFKGSLSAAEVANAIEAGVRRAVPDADIRLRPMADGGEGTLDAMLGQGGTRLRLSVSGAAGGRLEAAAGRLPDGSGLLEAAEIVGITDAHGMAVPVEQRSSLGLGEAIRLQLDAGVERILIALGGSSTNDGGAGMLVALGLKLFDAAGQPLAPTPEALVHLDRIDAGGLDTRLAGTALVALSDVDNPLNGQHGATAVFGPQKGVLPAQVAKLDACLAHFATLLEQALGRNARETPGAGAAGGLGFALFMVGAEFRPGAELVADGIGLDAALAGADWMITGEGRSDIQTLHGKAPFIACQRAARAGVPSTLLSGAVDTDALPRLSEHFAGCFSPAPGPITLDAALANAAPLLSAAAEQLARLRFS